MKDRRLNFYQEEKEESLEDFVNRGPTLRPEHVHLRAAFAPIFGPCDYRRFFRTPFTMQFLAMVVRHHPGWTW